MRKIARVLVVAAALAGCSAGPPPVPSTGSTQELPSPSAGPTVPAVEPAQQACDMVKAVNASGQVNLSTLDKIGTTGAASANSEISMRFRLVSDWALITSMSIQAGDNPEQYLDQAFAAVDELLTVCRANGYG